MIIMTWKNRIFEQFRHLLFGTVFDGQVWGLSFLCVIFVKCKMIQGETKSSNVNGHMVAEKLILMKERVR